MHRPRPQPALSAWPLLIAAAIAACTTGPSTDRETTAPASRGFTTPAITSSSAPAVELPGGFPVLPGAVPDQLPADDPGIIARWSSDQVGPVAYDFYVDALPAAGYPTTGLYPGGAVAVIGFQTLSGERWELVLTLHDGGTLIEVRLAQP
jgi:hypothetical protein